MSILITGSTGQDGRIISQKFESVGVQVYGIARDKVSYPDSLTNQIGRIDIGDSATFSNFLDNVRPTSIFHLAASHANSIEMQLHGAKAELEMYSVHAHATRTILEWQKSNPNNKSKLVVALSSQMFTANDGVTWIDEDTPTNPASKYGETKSQAFELIKKYRENYGVYASGAILFNHSSQFSKSDFVLTEIAKQIVEVLLGNTSRITLRNFETELDISGAENICSALVEMLTLEVPEDFVLASGFLTNLRKLTTDCLDHYNIFRRIELISTNPLQGPKKTLIGNSKKAKTKLNWQPSQDPVAILLNIVEAFRNKTSNV